MPYRLQSDRTLEFVVPGRILRKGAPPNRFTREAEEKERLSAESYKNIIQSYAKTAAVQQGWDVKLEDAVYIVLSINLRPLRFRHGTKKFQTVTDTDAIKKKMACEHDPHLQRIVNLVLQSLDGLAYIHRRQVVGLLVVKRYFKMDALEILVGVANSWGVLNHDLRNA